MLANRWRNEKSIKRAQSRLHVGTRPGEQPPFIALSGLPVLTSQLINIRTDVFKRRFIKRGIFERHFTKVNDPLLTDPLHHRFSVGIREEHVAVRTAGWVGQLEKMLRERQGNIERSLLARTNECNIDIVFHLP